MSFIDASDRIKIQSFHLGKRIAIVMIGSFLYTILINILGALLMKTM